MQNKVSTAEQIEQPFIIVERRKTFENGGRSGPR